MIGLIRAATVRRQSFRAKAEAAGGRVKFAYLSVDFANPTGETLDRAAREAVIDLADELDIAIVEDAAYQSLRFDGEAIPPILALEIARKGSIQAARTLYCGSFSKTLAPGLRIGWVCGAKISDCEAGASEAGGGSAFGDDEPDRGQSGCADDLRGSRCETAFGLHGAARSSVEGAETRDAGKRDMDEARGRHVRVADTAGTY